MHNGFASDVMIIVKHQNKRLFDGYENFVEQQINGAFGKSEQFVGRFRQIRQDVFAEIRREFFNSVRDIAEKNERIGIGMIELIPHRLTRSPTNEIGNQRRFAAARVSRDECHRRIEISL